jgi:adenosylmethionine-8-amino-7-oxononanoate aminotransferase
MNMMFTYYHDRDIRQIVSRVLHRVLSSSMPVAVRGDGPYIYDSEGQRYLDASGGAAVSCLGHGHPRVTQAIVEQSQALAFAHTSFFTNAPMEELADFLVKRSHGKMGRAAIVCDGSEAVEFSLKLARQYWTERGQMSRSQIISRRLSYHGMTLGALSVSGHYGRRARYTPYLFDGVEFVSPCYGYRFQEDDETDRAYGTRVADEVEQAIIRLGRENVSAFIAETVGGATAGCLMPVEGYFSRIREICDRYGVLWIADEVMCGMGRTGTLFAWEQEGVAPDLVVVAKGLGAGYQPIGAVLASTKIVDTIKKGSGTLAQGHTYMGHPIACATALAVQRCIDEENLLANVRRMGDLLERRLRQTLGAHPHVGDIRGRGLLWGVELVKDRAKKTPLDAVLRTHARIKQEAFRRGLICYPGGGTVDGIVGDHILLAPPYIIDETHIDEIVRILSATLDAVLMDL